MACSELTAHPVQGELMIPELNILLGKRIGYVIDI